ncbi:unnamed protein product, partial [Ectocarpus sp. 8 AP-2014]
LSPGLRVFRTHASTETAVSSSQKRLTKHNSPPLPHHSATKRPEHVVDAPLPAATPPCVLPRLRPSATITILVVASPSSALVLLLGRRRRRRRRRRGRRCRRRRCRRRPESGTGRPERGTSRPEQPPPRRRSRRRS